jgi:adenylate kinase family enzyme
VRISIVGVSCAGKSSLAKLISDKIDIPYIEQDQLFWYAGWKITSEEQFQKKVSEQITKESWVICGNFRETRTQVFDRATHIIWLNYPFSIVLKRAMKRTFIRVFKKQECCNGNYETFKHAYLSKNSIFYWILKTYKMRIRQYQNERNIAIEKGINFIEFRSPNDASRWLKSLTKPLDKYKKIQ